MNRFVIFSDTDNDITCVNRTLEFSELLNKNDDVEKNLTGLSIIHTGDFLDKKAPNLKVIEYWEELRKKIHAHGGFINILAGNHEQEIWQRICNGENYGLAKSSLDSLCGLIESLDLFYVDGPLLFIHSYPTVEFLRVLLHYKDVTGNHLNRFNTDHYKKAFKSVEGLKQYSYTNEGSSENYLLYDPKNIGAHYRKNGSEIATLLTELEIDCVIHGHRPQSSGIQTDHEFSKWLPQIRMIGNDTKVKLQGIGATLVRMDAGRAVQFFFINQRTANKKNSKKVQHLLRLSAPIAASSYQQIINSQQFRKLKKQKDALCQEHKNQLLQIEIELQEQRQSNLLLQKELQELEKCRHTREQTLGNLQLSHDANQHMEHELKQCINDKLKAEKSLVSTLKNVQELKQQAEHPKWALIVFVAIISSILTGVTAFYLF